jgi:hypothetical protein
MLLLTIFDNRMCVASITCYFALQTHSCFVIVMVISDHGIQNINTLLFVLNYYFWSLDSSLIIIIIILIISLSLQLLFTSYSEW